MNKRIIAGAVVAAFAVAGCEPDNQATYGNDATAQPGEALPTGGAERQLGAAQIAVASKDPYGQYLVDGEGRALYILEGTRQQGAQDTPRTQCTGACLAAWPEFQSQGAPGAAQGVEAGQIGTASAADGQRITYAGWPLYYYEADRSEGSTAGHGTTDEWGQWRLLSPSGEPIPGGERGKAPK